MPPTRTDTRDRLLDAAQEAVTRDGFAATSIERIIDAVGVTKGAFFHHFDSKGELARALIERFAQSDRELLDEMLARAEKLSDDPLQQLLIFCGFLIETAESLDETSDPGCLFATYCYESGLFEDDVNAVITDAVLAWRVVLLDKLRAAAAAHPPAREVDLESLADMATVLFEGAFVLARTTRTPKSFSRQLTHYRTYLRLLFEP